MDPGAYPTNYISSDRNRILQHARNTQQDPQQYSSYQQPQSAYRNSQDLYGNEAQSGNTLHRKYEAAGTLSNLVGSNQSRSTTSHNTNQQPQYLYGTNTPLPVPNPTPQPQPQGQGQSHPQHYYHDQQVAQALASGVDRSVSPAQFQVTHQLRNIHNQGNENTTIDPSSVYNPWPEYQRQIEAQAAKERAEAAEEARAEMVEKEKRDKGAKRVEEDEAARSAQEAARQKNAQKYQRRKAKRAAEKQAQQQQQQAQAVSSTPASASTDVPVDAAELQIRELMSRIRDMSGKHPDLLARIWDEERSAYLNTSAPPSLQKSPQLAQSASAAAPTAPRSQPSVTPVPRLSQPATPTVAPGISQSGPARRRNRWPEHLKQVAATAIVEWLREVPENRDIPSSREKFLKLLEGDPTYVELCESLEGMGYKINRAQLAKMLMPLINDKSSGSTAQPDQGRKVAGHGASCSPPASSLFRNPVSPVALHHASMSRPQQLAFSGSAPSHTASDNPMHWQPAGFDDNQGVDPYQIPTPHQFRVSTTPAPKEPTPASTGPMSKAEAARKNNIDDLIDLTTLSDDDIPPQPKRNFVYNKPPGSQGNRTHGDQFMDVQRAQQPAQSTGPNQLPSHLTFLQNRNAHALEQKCQNVVLVKQLERSKVARRSQYNPATIARDVLLATGKHPDLTALNGHLDILKTTLARIGAPGHRVDINSDLSTIRWDLIDPGKPEHLKNLPSDKPQHDADVMDVDEDSEMDVDDVADEEHVAAAQATKAAPPTPARNATVRQPPSSSTTNLPQLPLNRGRPPQASDFGVSINMYAAPHSTRTPDHASKPASVIPSSATVAAKGLSGYSAIKAAAAVAGVSQPRRGRPVGWRKHLHQKDPGSASVPHSALRSRLDASPDPATIPVKHTVFACRWAGCKAQLHNLDTLRKHVRKVHAQTTTNKSGQPVLTCAWERCGKTVRIHDPKYGTIGTRTQLNSFGDEDSWSAHVEQSHIGPVSWSLGDGPVGGIEGESS
jgi:hypothetical protein